MQSHWQNQPDPEALNREGAKNHVQRHNMAGFRAPKLDIVRVGVIGLGNRGPNHLKALVQIANVEIRALCDKNPAQLERGLVWARGAGHTPEIYTEGENEWKKLCEQADLDLVYVCTPFPLHAPMSIYAIYGTQGCARFDPEPPRLSTGGHWVGAEECAALRAHFTPEILRRLAAVSAGHGHGGSDLRMDWHLIDCLRHGLPLPQDVYDAVAWSCLVPLSQWSATHRSQAVDVPDFTAGAWQSNPRNMDVDLVNGGGDTRILPPSKEALAFDDELARQWARDHARSELETKGTAV